MAEIQIKTESSPARCEICHQSDLFDPLMNVCSRCATINKPSLTKIPQPKDDLAVFYKAAAIVILHCLALFLTISIFGLISGMKFIAIGLFSIINSFQTLFRSKKQKLNKTSKFLNILISDLSPVPAISVILIALSMFAQGLVQNKLGIMSILLIVTILGYAGYLLQQLRIRKREAEDQGLTNDKNKEMAN